MNLTFANTRLNLGIDSGLLENRVGGMPVGDGCRDGEAVPVGGIEPHLVATPALPDELAAVRNENVAQLRVKRLAHQSAGFALGKPLLELEAQTQGIVVDGECVSLNAVRSNGLNARHQLIEARRFSHQMQGIALGNPHPILGIVDDGDCDGGWEWDHVTHAGILHHGLTNENNICRRLRHGMTLGGGRHRQWRAIRRLRWH